MSSTEVLIERAPTYSLNSKLEEQYDCSVQKNTVVFVSKECKENVSVLHLSTISTFGVSSCCCHDFLLLHLMDGNLFTFKKLIFEENLKRKNMGRD